MGYKDEFDYGETHEPSRWIPTIEEFMSRWQSDPKAAAYLAPASFAELSGKGLPMRVVHVDHRRVVVVKP